MQRLGEEGVFCRRVKVDYASHSAADGRRSCRSWRGTVGPRAAGGPVPMFSTVTGSALRGDRAGRSILVPATCGRRCVWTSRSRALTGDRARVFVEASPHPVLAMPLSTASGAVRRRGGRLAAARGGGLRSPAARRSACCTCQGLVLDWEPAAGRAGGPGRWRCRPTRFSASATGWRTGVGCR